MKTFVQSDGIKVSIAWSPHRGPQEAAVACPVPDLFYGGARGGGKTDFLLGDFAIHAAIWGSRAKGILFRRTYPELDEVIARSKELYTQLGATYNEAKSVWTFPATQWDTENGRTHGATLRLRPLQKVADAGKYQGHSYTWIGVDEAGNFPTPEGIDRMRATLRTPHEKDGLRPVMRLTGNPGGVGHAWIKERYIKPHPAGYKRIRYQPQPDLMPDVWTEKVFIPSRVTDNHSLDVMAYRLRLAEAAQGNAALLKAWMLGDWDIFVGQAFWEWSQEVHVVPNGIQHIQQLGWRWIAGLDWGVRKGCFILAAQGPKGELEVVAEVVLQREDAKTAAKRVARKLRLFPRPEAIFCGHDMWQTSVDREGKTLAEEWMAGMAEVYGKGDLPILHRVEHGPGSRRVKYNAMHAALKWTDTRDSSGRVVPWARPMLRFQQRCDYLTSSIPSLPVDEEKPEDDVDTEGDDHGYDAVGMILLARMAPPEPEVPAVSPNRHPGFDPTQGGDGKVRAKRKKRYKSAKQWAEPADHDGGIGYRTPSGDELVELD